MVYELSKCCLCEKEYCNTSFWTFLVFNENSGFVEEKMFCSNQCFKRGHFGILPDSFYRKCEKCERVSRKCMFSGATPSDIRTTREYDSMVMIQRNQCGHEEHWIYSRRKGHDAEVLCVKITTAKCNFDLE